MARLSLDELRRDLFPRGWARAVGFEYATLVGLVWGLPLSTGKVRRDGDLIILTGLPQWAFKRGGVTVGRVYLTHDNDGPDVIEHEKVHVEQWRTYGFWMPVLYGLAGSNPFTNRFEREAGLEKGGYRRPTDGGGPTSSGPAPSGAGSSSAAEPSSDSASTGSPQHASRSDSTPAGAASSASLSAESDAPGPDIAPDAAGDTPPATRGEGARA